jgi:IPT/TIG domain
MIAGPRLTRIAGVFAVGLAALVVGTGQAFAGCSLVVGTSGANLTLSDPTDDLTGTTSVTLTGNGTVLTSTGLSVFAHSISLTITSEPVPTITGVSGGADHTSGSTGGGNILVINGANFLPQVTATLTGGACDGQAASYFYNDVASVNIGGTNASTIVVDSDSQIRVVVPQGIAGLANIIVSTADENSRAAGNNRYAYTAGGPSINGVGPNEGLTTIATSVSISGTNFIPGNWHDGTPVTTVNFPCFGNGSAKPSNVAVAAGQSASITLMTPICNQAGEGPGAVGVTVTVAGSTSGASQYLYLSPGTPHVTAITPSVGTISSTGNTGTVLGGTPVTISGSNFIGAVAVTFGATPANSFSVDSAGSITTQTPQQTAAGPEIITVTVNTGNNTLVTSPETNVIFTYLLPAPVINSISPNTGTTAGGTSVQIFGQYFTGATAVTIGGTAVTSFTVVSDTQINAKTGAHAAGNGLSVQVTTQYGTGTSGTAAGNAALYNYGVPPPTVSSAAPNTGPTGGSQTVTISGTYFTGVTGVTFGGVAATNSVLPPVTSTTSAR